MTVMRTALFIVVTGALLGAALLAPWTPAPLRMAEQLSGSASYTVRYLHSPVGEYRMEVGVHANTVTFATRLDTRLPGLGPTRIDEHFEFAARPPFQLLSAYRDERNDQHRQRTEVAEAPHGTGRYEVLLIRDGERARQQIEWHYRLADHVGLELALRGQQPDAGRHLTVRHLDLGQLTPATREWRVVSPPGANGGYRLRDASPGEDSLLQLDSRLMTEYISIADLLTFERDPGAGAIHPGSAQPRSAVVPGRGLNATGQALTLLDAPVPDPLRVASADIRVPAAIAAALGGTGLDWPHDDAHLLRLDAGRSRAAEYGAAAAASGPKAGVPSDHPTIRRLAERALAGPTDGRTAAAQSPGTIATDARREPLDQVQALTRFVHGYLEYRTDTWPLSVLDVIDTRAGDCTAFAGLFTTLARAAGLPTRTVTGLVYAETDGPGLYLHAWNEVLVDDEWHLVDATVGTDSPSALYIPFPDSHAGYLRAYSAFSGAGVNVESVSYF